VLIPTTVLTGSSSGGDTVISDQTLGADTQTISFTSIPGTYTHLRLFVLLRTDSANNDIGVRFNNDAGANYDWENFLVNNTSSVGWGSTQGVAATSFTAGYCASSTAVANEFGVYVIEIPFYTSRSILREHLPDRRWRDVAFDQRRHSD